MANIGEISGEVGRGTIVRWEAIQYNSSLKLAFNIVHLLQVPIDETLILKKKSTTKSEACILIRMGMQTVRKVEN